MSRKPAADEAKKLQAIIAPIANKQQALEDVFWSLLNTREFMFNH